MDSLLGNLLGSGPHSVKKSWNDEDAILFPALIVSGVLCLIMLLRREWIVGLVCGIIFLVLLSVRRRRAAR